jgi:hypothetical protein
MILSISHCCQLINCVSTRDIFKMAVFSNEVPTSTVPAPKQSVMLCTAVSPKNIYLLNSWFRSQHPPTQWNLRGGKEAMLNKVHKKIKKSKKSPC